MYSNSTTFKIINGTGEKKQTKSKAFGWLVKLAQGKFIRITRNKEIIYGFQDPKRYGTLKDAVDKAKSLLNINIHYN